MLANRGKHLRLQLFKDLGIPKEAGHVDQNFVIQRLDFLPVRLQILRVLLQSLQLVQHHSPLDAPTERGRLVASKVNAGRRSQEREDWVNALPGSGGSADLI